MAAIIPVVIKVRVVP